MHEGLLVCVQAALLSEREETKLALVMEKQALEEARTARIKVGIATVLEILRQQTTVWLEGISTRPCQPCVVGKSGAVSTRTASALRFCESAPPLNARNINMQCVNRHMLTNLFARSGKPSFPRSWLSVVA